MKSFLFYDPYKLRLSTSRPLRLIEKGIKRYGGVVVFSLFVFFLFEQGMAHFQHERKTLERRLLHLEKEKMEALKMQEDLKKQIAQHEDKEWIEQTLIRVLGVVPKGQRKVVFE